jgi:Zn-finger domain-containing protein
MVKKTYISHKLEPDIKKTVKNAEKQIHEDFGSQIIAEDRKKNKKMKIDEIHDLGRLYKLIDYGRVNRLLDNEVVIFGFGLQVLSDIR